MKALTFPESELGSKVETSEIPEELKAQAEEARGKLLEAAAEQDDALMEKYLESKPISEEELRAAIRKGCIAMKLFPVLCGAAAKLREPALLPVGDVAAIIPLEA